MREVVCSVEKGEREEMERLHERQVSLRNLLRRIERNTPADAYYAGIDAQEVRLAGSANLEFMRKWWDAILEKYELTRDHVYYVDLSSGDISADLDASQAAV